MLYQAFREITLVALVAQRDGLDRLAERHQLGLGQVLELCSAAVDVRVHERLRHLSWLSHRRRFDFVLVRDGRELLKGERFAEVQPGCHLESV